MHFVQRGILIAEVLLTLLLFSQPVHAQFTANFQTKIISGVTSNWTGDYLVGSNTFADTLSIQNSGALSNNAGYLGYQSSSSNNSAFVTGSGSIWRNGALNIGYFGGRNSLIVSNSGQVVNSGQASVNSSSNTVLITGAGSSWSNSSSFAVGGIGNNIAIDGGQLVSSSMTLNGESVDMEVRNGGQVFSGFDCTVGFQLPKNCLLVTGLGSVWNAGTLTIGYSSSENSLVISNGAQVFVNNCFLAWYGGSNNSVLVTGSGSVLSNSGAFVLANYGTLTKLTIRDGGKVFNTYSAIGDSSSGNSMLVADPGSVWSNSGTLIISGTSGNNLVISNGGQVFSDYGSLSGSSNLKSVMSDSVLVTGSNSLWSINNDFIITWRRNSLVIGNGGRVVSSYGYMGFNSVDISSVTGNLVVVTGPGSVWSNRNDLYVGYSGYKNSLVISNSGEVLNDDCYIGYNSSSSTNSVRVMDGAVWRSSAICVGYSGSSNSLLVAGGTVQATNLVIGFASALCNNLVRLDSGSVAVTNPAGDAVFEIRNGKLILSGGTLQVDRFVMTNACAQFVRTGGTLIYGTAVLDPNRDDDGDGLPNGWEQAHGLDPLNAADANVDSDGDGFTNLQEYLAGTDPQDSASSFRIIGIAPEGDDMRVTWMMGSGKTNALQAAAGDGGDYSNNFADIFTVTNTVGSQTNYLDLGAATNAPGRFYRVRLVP